MYTSKIYNNLRLNQPIQGGSIQTDAYILSSNDVIITPIHTQQLHQLPPPNYRQHQPQYSGVTVSATATPVVAYPTIARPQQQQ